MDDENPPLVIDCGSGMWKAGFAGDDAPRTAVPSMIGRSKYKPIMIGIIQKDSYVCDEAQAKRGILDLTYPIKHGIVSDWDDMEKLMHHVFYNELRVAPEEHPVLFTEPPLNSKKQREKMIEMMFEAFNVPKLFTEISSALALYAVGLTSGTVLDSGDGVTHCISIHEQNKIRKSVSRYDFGGREVTEYLMELLNKKGHSFKNSADREIVKDIKEKTCHTALDIKTETFSSKKYGLPDNKVISIDEEQYKCPEVLFDPSLICLSIPGIHEMIHDSILKSESEIRDLLFKNIILSGGNTMFNGIQERLTNELTSIVPNTFDIKVNAQEFRKYSAWVGGSVLASVSWFRSKWISKDEYDETGASIIHQKCCL